MFFFLIIYSSLVRRSKVRKLERSKECVWIIKKQKERQQERKKSNTVSDITDTG